MRTLTNAARDLKSGGLSAIIWRARQVLGLPAKAFQAHCSTFKDRRALEIGGPSPIFAKRGLLPIYPLAASVDNCNFGSETIWEGTIDKGNTFRFDPGKPPGRQFIAEATDLGQIPTSTYDLLLSSHMIEHTANPLKALAEWRRVLRPGGYLVLVVPDKRRTFDHTRPITPLDHLIEDFEADTGEDDTTHLDDFLRIDLRLAPHAGTYAEFKARSLRNFENRCMHHHVFDLAAATAMVEAGGFRVLASETRLPYHIIIIGQRD